MLELRKLSVGDGKDVYQMLQDIPLEENGLQNNVNGLTYEAYQDWLVKKQQESELDDIVDGWKVPLRHFLTDALRKAGGHIGYGIAPQYRGKGYGKELLKLLLRKADEMGIDKVLVTIHLDNRASLAVALANGGAIAEQTDERFLVWINTRQA